MPCRDERDEPGYGRGFDAGSNGIKNIEAMLCGAMTVLERHGLIGEIDFKEVGFTQTQYANWWAGHKRKDEVRRQREREERIRARTKAEALKKLTPAERKALGL